MPSLIDIRRRIRSVKNTQQITKAMKMVSAAKLRRAQERVVAARPYGAMLHRVLSNVAAAAAGNEEIGNSPLLKEHPENRIQVDPVHLRQRFGRSFQRQPAQSHTALHRRAPGCPELSSNWLGEKAATSFVADPYPITGDHVGILNKPAYADASAIARKIIDRFAER